MSVKKILLLNLYGQPTIFEKEIVSAAHGSSILRNLSPIPYVSGLQQETFIWPFSDANSDEYLLASNDLARLIGKPGDVQAQGAAAVQRLFVDNAGYNVVGRKLRNLNSPYFFSKYKFSNCIVGNTTSAKDGLINKLAQSQPDYLYREFINFLNRLEKACVNVLLESKKNPVNLSVLVIPTVPGDRSMRLWFNRLVSASLNAAGRGVFKKTCNFTGPAIFCNSDTEDGGEAINIQEEGLSSCVFSDPGLPNNKVVLIMPNYPLDGGKGVAAWWIPYLLEQNVRASSFTDLNVTGTKPVSADGAFVTSVDRSWIDFATGSSHDGFLSGFDFSTLSLPAFSRAGSSDIRIVRGYSLSALLYAYRANVTGFEAHFQANWMDLSALSVFPLPTGLSYTNEIYKSALRDYASIMGCTVVDKVVRDLNGSVVTVSVGAKAFFDAMRDQHNKSVWLIDNLVAGTNLFRFDFQRQLDVISVGTEYVPTIVAPPAPL